MKETELSVIKRGLPRRAKTSNLWLSSVTPLKLLQEKKIKHQKCAFGFRLSALRLYKMDGSEHVTFHTVQKRESDSIAENKSIAREQTLCMKRFHILFSLEHLLFIGTQAFSQENNS